MEVAAGAVEVTGAGLAGVTGAELLGLLTLLELWDAAGAGELGLPAVVLVQLAKSAAIAISSAAANHRVLMSKSSRCRAIPGLIFVA